MYYNSVVSKFFKSPAALFFAAFGAVEAAIYIAFMVIDNTTGQNTVPIRYCGIILCFVAAVLSIVFYGKDGIFLAVAQFFICIADLFMFVIDDFYEISLAAFIIVQLAHFVRIYMTTGKRPYISVAVRAAVIVAVMVVLGVTDSLFLLTALVAIYFPMLVINAVESAFLIKISKKYVLFCAGLWLFVGCDICVGLYNFDMLGIALSPFGLTFVGAAMWAFYLPSQALIAASGRRAELHNPFARGAVNEE